MPALDLVVPGDPATPTGGYLYDRRILEALGAQGWRTAVHALDASFPAATSAALDHAAATFAAIPTGRAVIIDGLALGGLAPLLATEARRLELVALVHHPLADETGLAPAARAELRRAELLSLTEVRRIVVTSRWTARRLAADGVPPERVRVVEPGTDRPARASGRRSGAATPALLCVATLTPRKGHALLLDALATLRDVPWRLDCVGSRSRDPATADAVRAQIARLGLESRVALHGELPHAALEERYRQADAFVLASHLEGYGMALAEALAHGLPVVSTTAGAIPDTVPPGTGLLVPPGDRAALAAALGTLLRDTKARRRLAAAARVAAAGLPTWEDAGARFAAAIADLAGDGPGSRMVCA